MGIINIAECNCKNNNRGQSLNEDQINCVRSLKREPENDDVFLSDHEKKCSRIIAYLSGTLTVV
jgi:hypothetical protein